MVAAKSTTAFAEVAEDSFWWRRGVKSGEKEEKMI
jgi:hypothetical protein